MTINMLIVPIIMAAVTMRDRVILIVFANHLGVDPIFHAVIDGMMFLNSMLAETRQIKMMSVRISIILIFVKLRQYYIPSKFIYPLVSLSLCELLRAGLEMRS
jgi:hypothetical protein